jgi:hypothetical protein
MSDNKQQGLFSFLTRPARSQARQPSTARPAVEHLEDRLVPAMVDMTYHGAVGSASGAMFRQYDAQPTGSGVINSFVRVQGKGTQAITQGYNTDHRPVQFDENTSPQFTRLLRLTDVPEVDLGGVRYKEFLLDINQKASSPLLSLDELRLYSSGNNLFGYANTQLGGNNAVFDLGNNWVKMDARLNQGSGKGDVIVDIPCASFTGGEYVYLYSKFGGTIAGNGGYEEWAAGTGITASNGTISGFVYSDGSQPVAGVRVFLDANHNGALDDNEVFTFTNADGSYCFDLLSTGLGDLSTYNVTLEQSTMSNFIPTSQTTFVENLTTQNPTVADVNFCVTAAAADYQPT